MGWTSRWHLFVIGGSATHYFAILHCAAIGRFPIVVRAVQIRRRTGRKSSRDRAVRPSLIAMHRRIG
jgi:hypothetical protein